MYIMLNQMPTRLAQGFWARNLETEIPAAKVQFSTLGSKIGNQHQFPTLSFLILAMDTQEFRNLLPDDLMILALKVFGDAESVRTWFYSPNEAIVGAICRERPVATFYPLKEGFIMVMKALLATVLAASLTFVSTPLLADSDTSTKIEQLLASFADKPEEHKALAALYREQAGEARKQAERHRQLKAKYNFPTGKGHAANAGMRTHCENIAKAYDEAGNSYEAMATEHEKMAK